MTVITGRIKEDVTPLPGKVSGGWMHCIWSMEAHGRAHRIDDRGYQCSDHHDFCAGVVCGDAEFIRSLVDLQVGPIMLMGPTMDAKVASELSLRLAHLGIRMAEHSRRAAAYAERLAQVPPTQTFPPLRQASTLDFPDDTQLTCTSLRCVQHCLQCLGSTCVLKSHAHQPAKICRLLTPCVR